MPSYVNIAWPSDSKEEAKSVKCLGTDTQRDFSG